MLLIKSFQLYIGSVFVRSTLREDTRIKEEKHQNYLASDAISDKDITDIHKLRVPRHATHQGLLCDIRFECVR